MRHGYAESIAHAEEAPGNELVVALSSILFPLPMAQLQLTGLIAAFEGLCPGGEFSSTIIKCSRYEFN